MEKVEIVLHDISKVNKNKRLYQNLDLDEYNSIKVLSDNRKINTPNDFSFGVRIIGDKVLYDTAPNNKEN